MENTILFVDDEKNILNSLLRLFRKDGYRILAAESGPQGLELLKANRAAAIVSDHRMPGMDGVEFLSKAKELQPDAVRFMLTGYADIKAVVEAINKGEVYRYITKPWNDDEIRLILKEAVDRYNILDENRRLQEITCRQNAELVELNRNLEAKVEEKTRKIRENFFAFVRIFSDVMELYDDHIGGHSKRVARLSRALALSMELEEADADLVESAALLHNIGLIGIPREILERDAEQMKEGEKALLRHNPVLSQDLLSTIDSLRQVGVIIRGHMERYDGKGYPDGLKKEEIHIGGRILAACKLYDNLKHGKKRLLLPDALEEMGKESGKSLDPAVVNSFKDFILNAKQQDLALGDSPERKLLIGSSSSEIRPGMTLAKNLMTGSGRLLATKGTVLTDAIIEKVLNFNNIDPIVDFVHVLDSR